MNGCRRFLFITVLDNELTLEIIFNDVPIFCLDAGSAPTGSRTTHRRPMLARFGYASGRDSQKTKVFMPGKDIPRDAGLRREWTLFASTFDALGGVYFGTRGAREELF
ncbi:MAG: hypothetical protein GPOALKHO_001179 [Sodalis sp.]|uniref:hypothetical protein n=1 Tax=Sodalis sp. (in: enterobacteria) TaxID=1898979 RepID=UPI0038739D64|nr:MAG: hypothetical protein GPOALKHO_001179 [Sodalis sp.]